MKKSAGILVYKRVDKELLIFLVHPGGPFWKNKDEGSWSIPKGEFTDEEPLSAALREFEEETGIAIEGELTALVPIRLKSGKMVYAWALEQDLDADTVTSNTFEVEWPPKSGKLQRFPEIDKAGWFTVAEGLRKINASQANLIQQLVSSFRQ